MAPGRDGREQEQQKGQGQGGITRCRSVVSLWAELLLQSAHCLPKHAVRPSSVCCRSTHTVTLRRSAASLSPAAKRTAGTICMGPTAC
jgi:hypothetical protein